MRAAGFAPGVVEFTCLLKGHLEAGDVAAAEGLFRAMRKESPPVRPDLRCANTFLRGCWKLGEVEAAVRFHPRLEAWGTEPDAATWKYLVQLLVQGLRLGEARRALRELRALDSTAALGRLDNEVGLNVAVARVACLLGVRGAADSALRRAEAARGSLQEDRYDSSWNFRTNFEQLRRQELDQEVAALREALQGDCGGRPEALVAGLARTFAFPVRAQGVAGAAAGAERPEDVPGEVLRCLRGSFGLEECLQRELVTPEAAAAQMRRCFAKDGRLRWRRVFGQPAGCALPMKLEVCSGVGDWVLAQAREEAGVAHWAACELRADRIHSILAKMVLGSATNLCVLSGDATTIVSDRIAACSLAVVCINFPEPPQRDRGASCEEAELSFHLLSPEFFRSVHAALEDKGVLTILSDNLGYTESLARTLGSLRQDGAPLFAAPSRLRPSAPVRNKVQHAQSGFRARI